MTDIFESIPTPEAAALIGFSRVSGKQTLFGSPFSHQGFITIQIKGCEVKRSHGRTWYFGKNQYIQVSMSYSQFAEAITAMNIGDGVPCTMEYLQGKGDFPQIEPIDERQYFDREADADMEQCKDKLQSAIAALDEVKLSAKDKQKLKESLTSAYMAISDSLPHVSKMYAEHMNDIEQKAKTEIVSYMDMTAHQYGLEQLQVLALAESKKD
jgi:hypothetical protein